VPFPKEGRLPSEGKLEGKELQLCNELMDMILEWDDDCDDADILARRIISKLPDWQREGMAGACTPARCQD
jgi:hypothetical protein